jgi:hypothetical protein
MSQALFINSWRIHAIFVEYMYGANKEYFLRMDILNAQKQMND